MVPRIHYKKPYLQSNLNSSTTDSSFTMANSNSVLSPYEILPIDQENKYLRRLSYFVMKLYVVCTTLNVQLLCRRSIDFLELAIFASRPGAMINLHWLEQPMTRTLFHGPKGEVRLYFKYFYTSNLKINIEKTKAIWIDFLSNSARIKSFVLVWKEYYV